MYLILVSSAMFAGVVTSLVVILLVTRQLVIGSGQVKIVVNDDEDAALHADRGGSLLKALAANDILIPSACGGQGTCGMCR